MGDVRFRRFYERLEKADDPAAEIRALTDEGVLSALAASSQCNDAYLSNVLATEAMNRLAQRGRFQRSLAASEARFRTAFDDAAIGMALVAPHGRYLRVNAAFCELVGCPASELLGKTYADVTHPEDVARTAEEIRRMLSGEAGSARFEKRYVHRDGRVVWAQVTASLVRDPDGAPLHFIGQVLDITDRKAAERAVERRLRSEEAIAAISRRLVAPDDLDAAIDACLADMGRLSGAHRAYLFQLRDGGETMDNTHEWCAPGVAPFIDSLQDIPTAVYPWWMRHLHDGRPLHVPDVRELPPEACTERLEFERQGIHSLLALPVRVHGELAGSIGFDWVGKAHAWSGEDARLLEVAAQMVGGALERAGAEARLRESEERYQLAIAGTNDGIWDWDIAGGTIYYAPRWKAMLGYAPHEVPDTTEAWQELIHPDDRERALDAVRAHLEGGERFYELEHRLRHRDGSYRWVLARGATIRDASGRAVRMVGSHTDITPRKRGEEQVRRLNAELERRVEARTRALEAANREVEAFSYRVSHDLRGHLRALNFVGEALLEDYADALDEQGRRQLHRLRDESRGLTNLVNGLLTLSLADRGEVHREAVDISRLAEKTLAGLQAREPHRRVEAHVEAGLTVEADPRFVPFVVENLIGNAWKYTAREPAARIDVGAAPGAPPPATAFFVADNGVGFDPRLAHDLFKPFQRLHCDGQFEGTGVGLATVERVVDRHGGAVWADGAPGEGAVFWFTLAPAPGAAGEVVEPPAGGVRPG